LFEVLPMSESHEPVKLANFSTAFEAERAVATLESAGIPAMVKSHAGGNIFGAGPVPGGVELYVRKKDVDRAWQLVVREAV
jgi:hypothetical protein